VFTVMRTLHLVTQVYRSATVHTAAQSGLVGRRPAERYDTFIIKSSHRPARLCRLSAAALGHICAACDKNCRYSGN